MGNSLQRKETHNLANDLFPHTLAGYAPSHSIVTGGTGVGTPCSDILGSSSDTFPLTVW